MEKFQNGIPGINLDLSMIWRKDMFLTYQLNSDTRYMTAGILKANMYGIEQGVWQDVIIT